MGYIAGYSITVPVSGVGFFPLFHFCLTIYNRTVRYGTSGRAEGADDESRITQMQYIQGTRRLPVH